MIDMWVGQVLRASVMLSISAVFVILCMRWRPLLSPRWHRLAWGTVLLQGLMLIPYSLAVPMPATFQHAVVKFAVEASVNEQTHPMENATVGELGIGIQKVGSNEAQVDPLVKPLLRAENEALSASEMKREVASIPLGRPETDGAKFMAKVPRLMPAWKMPDFYFLCVVVWLAGSAVVVAIFASNFVKLQRALRRCQPARPRWSAELNELSMELGVESSVPLYIHPHLGPFLCWGPGGHRIVVPVRLWNRLSSEERFAVLHHELCHLRRRDLSKSFLARTIAAIHWFNPVAWLSLRRFDESAEWACDAILSREAPARIPALAHAILQATQSPSHASTFVVAATGGVLVQRVRRLVNNVRTGDSIVKKASWAILLVTLCLVGAIRPIWEEAELSAQEVSSTAGSQVLQDDANFSTPDQAARIAEYASQISAGDNMELQEFIKVIQQPVGQIIMSDRAALAAQQAMSGVELADVWQSFVDAHFQEKQGKWVVKTEAANALSDYVQMVAQGRDSISEISALFADVASKLDPSQPLTPVVQRFLKHEGTATFVYHSELRSRLAPAKEEIEERYQEIFVRTKTGYAIRPTRKVMAQQVLAALEKSNGAMQRLHQELTAWSEDIVKADDEHRKFAQLLRSPEFAQFIVVQYLDGAESVTDDQLGDVFYALEEATRDTAEGLKLDKQSEQYEELRKNLARFEGTWQRRDLLLKPLTDFSDAIIAADEVHVRWKDFIKSDLGFLAFVKDMEYLPVDANEAAKEWLTQIVTEREDGKYDITVESAEDLTNRIEDYFREYREVRRRGRIVDEFADTVQDAAIASSMKQLIGKFSLVSLVESSTPEAEVDGLAVWFENHFEETADGLKLYDWAHDEIVGIVEESRELESELSKQDF